MFLRLPRWLSPAVRFRSAGIANTYTPPRFRPSLQPMEDRLCPATWTGADLVNPNDAGDPDNWDTGEVPGTGLDLVAQFDGTSSEDCDGLSGALEIYVDPGYGGTITLGNATGSNLNMVTATVVAPSAVTLGDFDISGGSFQAQSSLSANYINLLGGSVVVQGTATITDSVYVSGSASASLVSGGTVGDVEVEGGYLNLGADLTAHVLGLTGGEIDQEAGTNLTVDGDWETEPLEVFTWTGGILNNTLDLANVIITGPNTIATIDPGGGTVSLGSDLVLSNGAQLEFKTGTVAAHNDPKMKMTGGTSTKISLDFNDAVRITGVNHVELYTNDHLDISSTLASEPATWNTNFPLFNYGGTLKLFNSVTVTFSGEVVTPTATYPNTPYVQDGASSTFIENGSNLSVGATKWMRMTRGKLSTLYNENLPDTVADQTGTLTGNLRIDGGEITICDGIVVHHYGTFMVEGAVIMTGGTYKPVIDVGQSGHCDVWKTRSNFDVNSHPNYTASLSPISLGTPVATGSWIIISSLQGSFTGNFTGSNLVYDPGPPAKEYTPGTLGMPPYAVTLNI